MLRGVSSLEVFDSFSFFFFLLSSLLDLDMKKDIDTFIAGERAEILSKYDRVGRPLLKKHSQQKKMNSKSLECVCPVGVSGQERGCQNWPLGGRWLQHLYDHRPIWFSAVSYSCLNPLCRLSHIMSMSLKRLGSSHPFPRFFVSSLARKRCRIPAWSRRRYEPFKPGLCFHMSHVLGSSWTAVPSLLSKSSKSWSGWTNG